MAQDNIHVPGRTVNITGRTLDVKGVSVFAATVVLVSDSSIWTSSDMDGNFSIIAPSVEDTLRFICMGYKDLLVPGKGYRQGRYQRFCP